jgi:hypothetical protein
VQTPNLRSRFLGAAALVLALAGVPRAASADPRSLTGAYSDYEQQAIRDAEAELGTKIDSAPEGKIIERIDFLRLDPVGPHDALPTAIDVAHTTSRPWVLRREVLAGAREGQPWQAVIVDETARNLRKLPQLSVVLCVPMQGAAADRVRLVVITKDVWSLYVDFDLAVTGGGIEALTLEPKESNIAGLHHTALGRFVLEPQTLALGASYQIPRLDGRWLRIAADGNAIVNRTTGQLEGSYGSASIERPLVTSRTPWAWSFGTTFADRLRRRYINAAVATFMPEEPGSQAVPWVYRERTFEERAKITRSFGWETKNDVSLGATLRHARYAAPSDSSLDPRAVATFERAVVPTGEDRVGPFLQWHGYTSNFLRTLDLDTLGLQEDHRLGHDLWVRVYPTLRGLGSTRDFVGTYAGAAYGLALGDGLARASLETTVEATTHEISDASVKAALGIATPRFFMGRVVFNATALNRFRNYLNVQSFLGGNSELRGYPSRYFAGKDYVTTNLEYRTRSFEIGSILLGGVAFYDVGDAFNGFDRLDPKQSVGGGLRIVFPQIERAVLRLDVGVPIMAGARPSDVPPVSFFVAFHQAISLPSAGAGLGP